jgi:hypothetical protein
MNDPAEVQYKRYINEKIKTHLTSETIRDFSVDSLENFVNFMAEENLEEKTKDVMISNMSQLLGTAVNTGEYINFVYGLYVKKQALLALKKAEKNILLKEITNLKGFGGNPTHGSAFNDQLLDIVTNLNQTSSLWNLKWRSMKESAANQADFVDENQKIKADIPKSKPTPESNIDFGMYHNKEGDTYLKTEPDVDIQVKIPLRHKAQENRQPNTEINQVNPDNEKSEEKRVSKKIDELSLKINEYQERNAYKFNPLKHAAQIFKGIIVKDAQQETNQQYFNNFMPMQKPTDQFQSLYKKKPCNKIKNNSFILRKPHFPAKPKSSIRVRPTNIFTTKSFPRSIIGRVKKHNSWFNKKMNSHLKNLRNIRPKRTPKWIKKVLKNKNSSHLKFMIKKAKHINFQNWMKTNFNKNHKKNDLLKQLQSSGKKSYLSKFLKNNSYTSEIKRSKQSVSKVMQVTYQVLKQRIKILKALNEEQEVILEQLQNCKHLHKGLTATLRCSSEKMERYINNIKSHAKLKFSIFKKIGVIRKSLAKTLFHEKKLNSKNKEILNYFQKKALKGKNSERVLKSKVYKSNLGKLIIFNKRKINLKLINKKKLDKRFKYIVHKLKSDKRNFKKKVVASLEEKNQKLKFLKADLVMEEGNIKFWSKKYTDLKFRIRNLQRKTNVKPKIIRTLSKLFKLISQKIEFHNLKVK